MSYDIEAIGYLYHEVSVCHDVRKNMDEWARQHLLFSGPDASFFVDA